MDEPNKRQRKQAMRERRRKMLDLKEDGYSGPEIAEQYGIKSQGVYAQIKKAIRERAQERRIATLKEQEAIQT
jgi:predicted DNA-binding protein YlxM (UPF0122 family)